MSLYLCPIYSPCWQRGLGAGRRRYGRWRRPGGRAAAVGGRRWPGRHLSHGRVMNHNTAPAPNSAPAPATTTGSIVSEEFGDVNQYKELNAIGTGDVWADIYCTVFILVRVLMLL